MLSLPFGLLTGKAFQLAKCVNIFSSHVSPVATTAGFQVRRDGTIYKNQGGVLTYLSDYVTVGLPDPDVGIRYEIFVTKTGGAGTLDIDAGLDTWLPINGTLSWAVSDTPGAFRNWLGTYQIREIADPGNIAGPCSLTFDTEDGS